MLCSKLLNNNFQHNLIYQHLIKTSKFWQNKESEIFLWQLGYNSIKAYILNVAAEGHHFWQPIWIIYKYMVNHKYTDQLAAMKPLRRNGKLEIKYCVEMHIQTNWLIDTHFSVDYRILRIVEFDLKLVDCSKKPTNYMNMSCRNHVKFQNSNTASWLKIQVDSIFIEQPVLS